MNCNQNVLQSVSLLPTGRCSDEELASCAIYDPRAMELLLKRYTPMVRSLARRYFLQGAEREDIFQEGVIGLWEAIRGYSSEHACSFSTFARLCVTRQILSAVKTYSRQKCSVLNTAVSVYAAAGDEQEQPEELELRDMSLPSMDEWMIERERAARVRAYVEKSFSETEKFVFVLFSEGRSYQEISELCGRPVKSVDGTLQRIRRKLAQLRETERLCE